MLFRRNERTGDLLGDIESKDAVERSLPFHPGKDRLAVDEFHRVEIAVAMLAQVENGRHVSMPQPRRDSRLAQKTLGRVFAVQETGSDDFQRDVTVQIRIKGFVGHAHGAAPQFHERAV